MLPAMRPRALLGASCESNGSKEKTLKSGAVGSRVLAGQRLKQADFTFQDPSRGFGTTTHVPSADPRTLQLHLRDFPLDSCTVPKTRVNSLLFKWRPSREGTPCGDALRVAVYEGYHLLRQAPRGPVEGLYPEEAL